MRIIYFQIQIFILSFSSTFAFLNLFGSKNLEEKKLYTPKFLENAVLNTRGVPQSMFETFELSIFQCDKGMKTLTNDAINDGYCDCIDGTDEPGTSACSGLSVQPISFYCLNKGFRMIKIPSSRVDDSVCDCCDGSDENRLIECPNVCDAAAAQEKEAIKKITSSYNIGSIIREGNIHKIKSEKELKANTFTQLIEDIDRQKIDTDALGIECDKEKELIERSKVDINYKYFNNVKEILGLNLIKSESDLAQILSALFDVIDLSDNEVKSLVNSATSNNDFNSVPDDDDDDDNNEEKFPEDEDSMHSDDMHSDDMHSDHIHSDDYYGNKEYDEEEHVHNDGDDDTTFNEEEIITLDDDVHVTSDDNTEVKTTTDSTCSLQNYSTDIRLNHLCTKFSSSNSKIDDIAIFIVKMIQSKRAYIDSQIVFGHFQNKGSFLTPNENLYQRKQNLVKLNLENSDNNENSCEADYKTSCNIKSDLNSLFSNLELELQILTTQSKPASIKHIEALNLLSNLENTKKEVLEAKNDLELFKNKLEYLALKNQCFSVVDGKFTYDMCVLKDVSQNDDGNSRVTLGSYSSIEDKDDGSVVMKFGNGQHCHAFGPRTADVTIRCGPENKLLSASEPSTCFYTFDMESPAACTKKFAEYHGIY